MSFESTLKIALISAYIDTYGPEARNRQTDAEKAETLHNLFISFLTVTKNTQRGA